MASSKRMSYCFLVLGSTAASSLSSSPMLMFCVFTESETSYSCRVLRLLVVIILPVPNIGKPAYVHPHVPHC